MLRACRKGGSWCGCVWQVVSMEGLERLVLELQNATVGRSLQLCLQTALLAPQNTLVIAVQTCLLEHNVVGALHCSASVVAAIVMSTMPLSYCPTTSKFAFQTPYR